MTREELLQTAKPMKIGKACAIFDQIDSDKYSRREKDHAIKMVLDMPTHNGITKDTMLKVIKHLLYQLYEEVESEE